MYYIILILILISIIYFQYNQTDVIKIYLFYPDESKYNELKDEFDSVESKLSGFKLIKIDCDDPKNKKFKRNFKVKGMCLVKVFTNGSRSTYDGKYNSSDILEWVYDTAID